MMATQLLSLGTPMILGGDEMGRTQRGNNNAYCQDNEISWHDWTLLEAYEGFNRFCREMVAFRKENPALTRSRYFTGAPMPENSAPDVMWFGPDGKALDWSADDPWIGLWINPAENGGTALYLMFNPSEEETAFRLPPAEWRVRVATQEDSPRDVCSWDDATPVEGDTFTLAPRSLAVLAAREYEMPRLEPRVKRIDTREATEGEPEKALD
jgi:glycogen operon protein